MATASSAHLEEALTLFLSLQHNRPSTAMETERLLKRHVLPELGPRTLQEIDSRYPANNGRHARDALEANHAFTALRTMLRWATTRRYIPHSPMEGLKLPARAQARSRTLSPSELRTAFAVAQERGEYGQTFDC